MLKLHSYFRSSAAYRCRIALNLKGLAHEMAYVHLIKDGGQHTAPAYRALNPQAWCRRWRSTAASSRSRWPSSSTWTRRTPSRTLLPGDALQRARIRAFALAIACDIHPLNNLRVLNYLKGPMGQQQAAVDTWYRHWVEIGPGRLRGAAAGGQEPVLLRRSADARRLLPGAAGLQRAPLQLRPVEGAAPRRHRRSLPRPAGVRATPRRSAAGCGVDVVSACLASCEIKHSRSMISGVNFTTRDADAGHCHGQLEASRTSASWVDVQNALARFDRGLMRVAEHDGCEARGGWIEVELRNLVQHPKHQLRQP